MRTGIFVQVVVKCCYDCTCDKSTSALAEVVDGEVVLENSDLPGQWCIHEGRAYCEAWHINHKD